MVSSGNRYKRTHAERELTGAWRCHFAFSDRLLLTVSVLGISDTVLCCSEMFVAPEKRYAVWYFTGVYRDYCIIQPFTQTPGTASTTYIDIMHSTAQEAKDLSLNTLFHYEDHMSYWLNYIQPHLSVQIICIRTIRSVKKGNENIPDPSLPQNILMPQLVSPHALVGK